MASDSTPTGNTVATPGRVTLTYFSPFFPFPSFLIPPILLLLLLLLTSPPIQRSVQLIEKKVDLDAQDGDGWTALMYAVSVGAADAVSKLIAAGVDTSIKNKDGETAMDMCKASKKRHPLIQIIDPKEPLPTVAE